MSYESSQQYLLNVKMNFTIDDITRNLPLQVNMIFRYVSSLKIYEKPDYNYIKKILAKYLNARMIQLNIKKAHLFYDWIRYGLLKKLGSEFQTGVTAQESEKVAKKEEEERTVAWDKIETDEINDDDESYKLDGDAIHNMSSK